MNPVNPVYDVVVVGRGPVGINTASLIHTMNSKLRICVLDKKLPRDHDLKVTCPACEKSKSVHATREHGLRLGNDVLNTLIAAIKNGADKALTSIYQNWKGSWFKRSKVVRTTEIEDKMADHAEKVGIKVLRGPQYTVTEDNLDRILESEGKIRDESENSLREIFRHAKVVIAADGAHSAIRKKVMGPDKQVLVDLRNLQYFIELKYDTPDTTETRTKVQKGRLASKSGVVVIHNMPHGPQPGGVKRGTEHMFADEETYKSFMEISAQDRKTKGTTDSPWTWAELEERAKVNPRVKSAMDSFKLHLGRTEHSNEQIKTIRLDIYRSDEVVKRYKGKVFATAGDASSGMVLERGVNKGLREALAVAKATVAYFARMETESAAETELPVPREFSAYQIEAKKIFQNEKWWIELKSFRLRYASLLLSAVTWAPRTLRTKVMAVWAAFQEKHTGKKMLKPLQVAASFLDKVDTVL